MKTINQQYQQQQKQQLNINAKQNINNSSTSYINDNSNENNSKKGLLHNSSSKVISTLKSNTSTTNNTTNPNNTSYTQTSKPPLYKSLSPKVNYMFNSNNNTSNNNSYIEHHSKQNSSNNNKNNNKSLNDSKIRSNHSVANYLDRRHRESQEKLNKLRNELHNNENQNMTFKPKISNTSQIIVQKLLNSNENTDDYDFNQIISQVTPTSYSIINQNNINSSQIGNPSSSVKKNINSNSFGSNIKRIIHYNQNSSNKQGPVKLKANNEIYGLSNNNTNNNGRSNVNSFNHHSKSNVYSNTSSNVNNSLVNNDNFLKTDVNNNSHIHNHSNVSMNWKDNAQEDLMRVVQNRYQILNKKNEENNVSINI